MKVDFLIQPNAKRTEFVTVHNGKIKVKISAKPIDYAANDELLNFISKKLSIAKSKIKIAHGSKGKNKVIEIDKDISIDELISELSS